MKNHWYLLFGFGFLFAGFARFVSTPLALPAFPFDKSSPVETIRTSKDHFSEPIETSKIGNVVTNDEVSKISIHSTDQLMVSGKRDPAGGLSILPDDGLKDDFIENSFVTVSEDNGYQVVDEIVTKLVPDRIVIPDIQLDAPIVISQTRKVTVEGKIFDQWLAPDKYAGGWQTSSAALGETGNMVINGHHNEFGEVFKRLIDLDAGDEIIVFSGEKAIEYVIANRLVLPERKVKLETRISNARWIQQSNDERLTLVTCWPYENNTHRLILVAVPNR